VKIIIGPQSSVELGMIKPYADAHNILVISQGSTVSSVAIPGDNRLESDSALQGFEFTEIVTDFEFLVNSNSYPRVRRA
jgi:hypothetical protein